MVLEHCFIGIIDDLKDTSDTLQILTKLMNHEKLIYCYVVYG